MRSYRILDQRMRTPLVEVDLIARRGDLAAFVEVEHRARLDAAAGSVTLGAWQRISRATDLWMAITGRAPGAAGITTSSSSSRATCRG